MAANDVTKTCTKCGEEKPRSAFYRFKHSKDGLNSWCKLCQNISNAKWTVANIEKIRAIKRKWVANNKEARNKWLREYREKNRELISTWAANRRGRKNDAPFGTYGAWRMKDVKKILLLQRGKCVVCKRDLNGRYHRDHVVPLAQGGQHNHKNLQLLCPSCNMRKSSKDPIRFMQERGFLI